MIGQKACIVARFLFLFYRCWWSGYKCKRLGNLGDSMRRRKGMSKRNEGRRCWKKGILFFIILILLLWLGLGLWQKPPVQEMEKARQVLAEAEEVKADKYCRLSYRAVWALYDSAGAVWRRENQKCFGFRQYEKVRLLAEEVRLKGKQIVEKTIKLSHSSRDRLRVDLAVLRLEMESFEQWIVTMPLEEKIKKEYAEGKILLNEAEIAWHKKEYTAGEGKYEEAAGKIRYVHSCIRDMLTSYFNRLPLWQRYLEEAIEKNRQSGNCLIVVEKIPARCRVYERGKERYTFAAEFGKNWLGDKFCEGDYATPEGHYQVMEKKQGRFTRYYKALLLNYPNAADWKRFDELKKTGKLPERAQIGSMIEIHGKGGRQANWTNGCVALRDEDMDKLFRSARKGTEVLIIGASQSLSQILKEDE